MSSLRGSIASSKRVLECTLLGEDLERADFDTLHALRSTSSSLLFVSQKRAEEKIGPWDNLKRVLSVA